MALEKIPREYKGKTYYNVKMQDLGYDQSATIKLKFDQPKVSPSTKFTNKDGTPKDNVVYNIEVIEPNLGEVSFFCPAHLHRDLSSFRRGDVVKLTPVPKEINAPGPNGATIKRTYKGFKVERVQLSLNEEDQEKVIKAIQEIGTMPSESDLRDILREYGYTKENEIQSILTRLNR